MVCTTNHVSIRLALQQDCAQLADIQSTTWKTVYKSIFPPHFLDETLGSLMKAKWSSLPESGVIVVVAEEQQATQDDSCTTVVGFVAAKYSGPEQAAFIDNLHVRPSCQSRGIGRALMVGLGKELLRRGFHAAYLLVFVENQGAIQFYHRLGGAMSTNTEDATLLGGYTAPCFRVTWSNLESFVLQQQER